jgi:hypothetical protein
MREDAVEPFHSHSRQVSPKPVKATGDLGSHTADSSEPKSEEWRALIEFVVSLGFALLLEEIFMPFQEVTRQRIEVGTVLVFSNFWWLFHGVVRPKADR